MGIDYFDLTFRVERAFGVKVEVKDLPTEAFRDGTRQRAGDGLTAGLFSDVVQRKLNAQRQAVGQPPAGDIWPQMRQIIAETVQADPQTVTRDSRLIKDLGYA